MNLLNLYFGFKGRLSLKDFWLYWNIPFFLGGALLSYLLINVFFYPNVRHAIGLFLTWPFLATSAKRLHDRNLSGSLLLLHLIPVLGSIILFIPIYLTSGTKGKNRYDPDYVEPHPEKYLTRNQKVFFTVSLLLAFQLLCFFGNKSLLGIIYTDGPYYGRVVNSETEEPITGAAIAGVWEWGKIVPPLTIWTFADAQETVTDQQGKFKLPREWKFTPWIMTTQLELSDLYVFKSGYDSHPPYMQKYWSKEDEQKRNMTRGEYYITYLRRCKPNKECIVELTPTQTEMERSAAYGGARIDEIPQKDKKIIRNYINAVSAYGKQIGVKEKNIWKVE